jgi:hypothetical protein
MFGLNYMSKDALFEEKQIIDIKARLNVDVKIFLKP